MPRLIDLNMTASEEAMFRDSKILLWEGLEAGLIATTNLDGHEIAVYDYYMVLKELMHLIEGSMDDAEDYFAYNYQRNGPKEPICIVRVADVIWIKNNANRHPDHSPSGIDPDNP